MGKNIIGENFNDYVRGQVKTRQKLLGKTSKQYKELLAYNANSPYIKLTSSVNLLSAQELAEIDGAEFKEGPSPEQDELYGPGIYLTRANFIQNKTALYTTNGILARLVNLGIDRSLLVGNNLAKNCILFGGVSNSDGSVNFGLNAGAGSSKFKGAYGWGGVEDRGYVPMPGITSIQTKYYNNGALSEATINIKCFSKTQFALIDVLYLRPGYTLLLEFGHSTYIKNDNLLYSKVGNTSVFNKFINGSANQFDLYSEIEAVRKISDGNYEAIYGKITKFSWRFNKDGSYDCVVNVIGLGSIIESFKANANVVNNNTLTNTLDILPGSLYYRLKVARESKSLLHAFLLHHRFRIGQSANAGIEEPTASKIITEPDYVKNVTTYHASNSGTGYYDVNGNQYQDDNYAKIVSIDARYKGVDRNSDGSTGAVTLQEAVLGIVGIMTPNEEGEFDRGQSLKYRSYIKLGAIISFLQNKCLIYDNSNVPFFRFDMTDGGADVGDFINQRFKDDENYHFSIPGSNTTNPNIALVPHRDTPNGYKKRVITGFDINLKAHLAKMSDYDYEVEGEPYACKLSQIFVRIGHALSILDNNVDDKGNIAILPFLKTLLSDIFRALGGYTDIEITVTDDGLVKFINKVPPQFGGLIDYEADETTKFNTFGVLPGVEGSFVREVDIVSELSPEFGSMIAIGAQANGNQIESNSTSFAAYNHGLQDRVIKDKRNILINDTEATPTETYAEMVEASNEARRELMGTLNFSQGNIDIFENAENQRIQYLLGILTNDSVTLPFFLPFNLTLTLDGISGIKLYQRFKINDNVLPPSYTSRMVDLIVNSVDHEVTPSGWVTKIGTLAAPSPISGELGPPAENGDGDPVVEDQTNSNNSGGNTNNYTPGGSGQIPIPPDSSGGEVPEVTVPTEFNEYGLAQSQLGLSDGKVDKLEFFLPVPYYIRNDGGGRGNYGAPRRGRRHKGLDLISYPGQEIRSPIDGIVKTTRAASDKKLLGTKIIGTGDFEGYQSLMFYVYPFKHLRGTEVKKGDVVAVQQDLSKNNNTFSESGGDYSESVGDHVHFDVRSMGNKKFNPTLGLGVINYDPSSLTYGYLGNEVTLRNLNGDVTGKGPVDPRITT